MAENPRRYRLGRARRLRTRRAIARVFAARCVASDTRLVVHACANDGEPMRMAVVIGRAYGTAVQRNRFKRLVREAFRLDQHDCPAGFDVIVRPKGKHAEITLPEMREALGGLIAAAVRRAARR